MARLRVHNFSISVDGYGAGPNQDLDNPLGVGGERLHKWAFQTPTFGAAPRAEGEESIDDEFAARGEQGFGATIMGRNMFGPIRGSWGVDEWRGWWGEDPPYHHPVFVLTHHPQDPIEMDGGTTFHFVTDGVHAARNRALDAADGQDVRIGGGSSTIRQYMEAGLVDELHIAIVPTLLGSGESLFGGIDAAALGYQCVEFASSADATHVVLARQD